MQNGSAILDGFGGGRSPFRIVAAYAVLALAVVVLGLYVGNVLFGDRGLGVLLGLRAKKRELQSSVESLKNSNAALQKEYFELVGLDPNSYKR